MRVWRRPIILIDAVLRVLYEYCAAHRPGDVHDVLAGRDDILLIVFNIDRVLRALLSGIRQPDIKEPNFFNPEAGVQLITMNVTNAVRDRMISCLVPTNSNVWRILNRVVCCVSANYFDVLNVEDGDPGGDVTGDVNRSKEADSRVSK